MTGQKAPSGESRKYRGIREEGTKQKEWKEIIVDRPVK